MLDSRDTEKKWHPCLLTGFEGLGNVIVLSHFLLYTRAVAACWRCSELTGYMHAIGFVKTEHCPRLHDSN